MKEFFFFFLLKLKLKRMAAHCKRCGSKLSIYLSSEHEG